MEFPFTTDKSDSRDDNALQTHSKSNYTSSGKASVGTYLTHYDGRYVLAAGDDGISSAATSGNINAGGSDHSPSSSSEYSENASAVKSPLPLVSFEYENGMHWSATGKIHYEGTRTYGRGPEKETPDDGWDAGPDNATITHNGAAFIITRKIAEHRNDAHGTVVQRSGVSGSFTMTVTPDKPEKYVAFFEPVDGQQAYEQWMPEGYAETPRQHGNFIDIKIKVENPAKAGTDFTSQIRYKLPKSR